jgi:hypothetical protein
MLKLNIPPILTLQRIGKLTNLSTTVFQHYLLFREGYTETKDGKITSIGNLSDPEATYDKQASQKLSINSNQ